MTRTFPELRSSLGDMTEKELFLWQRMAIFECVCDNYINQRIESDYRPSGRSFIIRNHGYGTAVDAAMSKIGFYLIRNDDFNPPSRSTFGRRAPISMVQDIDPDTTAEADVLRIAYSAAARNLGLNVTNPDH